MDRRAWQTIVHRVAKSVTERAHMNDSHIKISKLKTVTETFEYFSKQKNFNTSIISLNLNSVIIKINDGDLDLSSHPSSDNTVILTLSETQPPPITLLLCTLLVLIFSKSVFLEKLVLHL